MHKNEFIKQLAKETTLPQKEVNQVIKGAVDLIARRLKDGDKVVITGFGTFEVRRRRARRGVNPKTKERITIPETQTPGFTASNTLKLSVLGQLEAANLMDHAENDGTDNSNGVSEVKAVRPRGRKKVTA
ncbi:MAG: histone family protein DNA-binding protein [Chloroflexi bacterium]|jgi:DNA-binding protein HU-beta|nr:histone family protein DNA-binding protein [Chloroflexota bacterium]